MIIDLTQKLFNNMPKTKGDFGLRLDPVKTIEKDGYRDTKLTMNTHTSTHIDSPAHMIKDGKSLKDYPLSHFITEGSILTHKMIQAKTTAHIIPGGALIIPTGHDAHFLEDNYYKDYPVLPSEIIEIVKAYNIKMIILDTPSPDHAPYTLHHALFNADVLIVENAKNLTTLSKEKPMIIHAIPLNLETDGAPIRLFAKISEKL